MKTCSRSALVFMWFIYITSQGLEAQEVKVQPEVTGYLERDATLQCQFIPGPEKSHVIQVQWVRKPTTGEKSIIIVSNYAFRVSAQYTILKERWELAEQSLIIRNVEVEDAGLYTCTIVTFPGGMFEGTTNFVVQEQMLIPRMITARLFVLVVVTMVATTCFIIIRIRYRREALVMHHVCTDTASPAISD